MKDYLNKTIKIEFIPDKEAEEMLKKNCSYRHFLYNKCVEIVKYNQENDPDGYIGTISKYDLLWDIRKYYEKSYSVRPEYLEDYDYYFRGISECALDDIMSTIQRIITKRSEGESSDINFMKYNPNKLSFRFENKLHRERKPKSNGLYHGNSIVLSDNPYHIGIKINNTYGYPLGLTLREPITKFNIDFNEVREIGFKFHNEKWYLCLILRDKDYSDLVDIHYKRKEVAGIDLGETNPVVIYDGKRIKSIPKHLQYPKDRINKVEKRIRRLQRVMDRKYNHDLKKVGLPQSNNYYKVLKKFHKAWEHLVNIKKDWHFKLAHWIVTHYRNIVVDEFKDHIVEKWKEYPTQLRQRYNHSMQNKSMYDFTQRLIHMCIKYGTNYFKPKFETTNTCSICGNVNSIKLDINNRTFKCECCDNIMDRDVNASINCYNAFFNGNIINTL